ncbi:MAG TPA: hypothetical protein VFM45_11320 [Anaeromyxobacteraceae bacterium]|nr:hypothetical protein [Anaeromyxobacteraceae bacterium]
MEKVEEGIEAELLVHREPVELGDAGKQVRQRGVLAADEVADA